MEWNDGMQELPYHYLSLSFSLFCSHSESVLSMMQCGVGGCSSGRMQVFSKPCVATWGRLRARNGVEGEEDAEKELVLALGEEEGKPVPNEHCSSP